jgi:small subunit ribosomal protein S25e
LTEKTYKVRRLLFSSEFEGLRMGGKKKQTKKRAGKPEKTQKRKTGKKEKRAGAAVAQKKSIPGITLPTLEGEDFMAELKNMKMLTPYSVASRFDLRLSVAKAFLRELERKDTIKFVSKSRSLRIYKPTH